MDRRTAGFGLSVALVVAGILLASGAAALFGADAPVTGNTFSTGTLTAASDLKISAGCDVDGGAAIKAGWTATPSSFAQGYRIRRYVGATLDNEQQLSPRLATGIVDEPVDPSTTYTYRVTSIYEAWSSGDLVGSITTPVCTPPKPELRSVGTGSATGSTLVVDAPPGVASGDVLVAQVTWVDDQRTGSVTAPSGWTFIRRDSDGSRIWQWLFVKVAGVSEPASYTFTSTSTGADEAAGAVGAYTGVDNAAPINAHSGTGGKAAMLTAPSVTTTASGSLLVALYGQKSDGPVLDSVFPVPVSALADAIDIDAGVKHSSAVTGDGRAHCWGDNADGQLGDGTKTAASTPVRVRNLAGLVATAASEKHSCAIGTDGSAWCWGKGDHGRLGNGTTDNSLIPIRVAGVDGTGLLTTASSIETGPLTEHTCSVLTDGTAACWGKNGEGQLGDGTKNDRLHPVHLDGAGGSPLTNVAAVATGTQHTCVARTDGSVWCVGKNGDGQLGNGMTSDSLVPVRVVGVGGAGFLSNVVDVSAGEKQTCAVRSDTTVVCWGKNDRGQLGDGTGSNSSSPVVVRTGAGPLTGAATVGVGREFGCATTTTNATWCWGKNDKGQLGDGTKNDTNGAVRVVNADASPFSGGSAVSGGVQHTCARRTDGTVWCWGDNDKGRLGSGAIVPAASMTEQWEVLANKPIIESADETVPSAGATGSRTATSSKDAEYVAQLIALRPG